MLTAIITILTCLVGVAAIAAFILYVIPYLFSLWNWGHDLLLQVCAFFPSWVYPIFIAGLCLAIASIVVKVV